MTSEQNETQLDPDRVYVYALGLMSASACAPSALTAGQVAASVNAQIPTGISSPWQASADPFADGTANPGPCDQEPEGRRHWLMEC